MLTAHPDVLAAGVTRVTDVIALPKFWEQHKQVLIETPIRIVSIIVISLLIRAVLRRLIDRAVRPATNPHDVPKLLRPFKERLDAHSFLESAGLLSERRKQRAATLGSVLKSATSITIFVIAFLLIISELRVDLAPFIAGTSIVGVALGFGAQNIVKDFLSGMFMLLEDQYGVGDHVDLGDAVGSIEHVGLRTTTVRDVSGMVWYVRNGTIERVGNGSQDHAVAVVDVPLALDTDTEKASKIADAAARHVAGNGHAPDMLGSPEVLGLQQISASGMTLRLTARTRPGRQWAVQRAMTERVVRDLRAEDVTLAG